MSVLGTVQSPRDAGKSHLPSLQGTFCSMSRKSDKTVYLGEHVFAEAFNAMQC